MARQLKFCHACRNEFYDAPTCPRCHSDFIEEIDSLHDPAAFYEDDEDEDEDFPTHDSPFPFHQPHMPAPPPPPPHTRPQQQQPRPIPSPFPAPPPRMPGNFPDPFGLGSFQQPSRTGSGGSPAPVQQPANPMFMDGYRTILEQLLGGISPQQAARQPGQYQDMYGGQQVPPPAQQPRRTGHFSFSMTTMGPDGRIHHISNSSGSNPPAPGPGGRQIPVPTVNDFLGMQQLGPDGGRDYQQTPFADGSLGMVLQHLMQSMAQPMHGHPGDYIPHGMTMDDLISQLMEQGQGSTGPPPASTDLIDSLPQYKADKGLVEGDKECTICKDGFHLGDDVTNLPCSHVFHQDCILPWLKINGSCPVCRHTLSAQTTEDQSSPSTSTRSTSQPGNNNASPWSLGSFLSSLGQRRSSTGNDGNSSGTGNRQGHRRDDSFPPEEDLD